MRETGVADSDNGAASAEPAVEPQATRYSWYVLSVLVVVYILNFIDRQIVSILAVDIQRDLNIDNSDMGFLMGAAFGVFYALFGIPLGRLADNWSRVKLLSIGLALWSAMTALSGFSKNFLQLGLARMGVGIGEATASPSAYSLISDYFPKRQRATALAIYSSGLYIGGGASLFIGALIKQNWDRAFPGGGPLGLVGWQAAFVAVGLPGLLVALWVFSLREPKRGAMDGTPVVMSPTPFRDFVYDLSTIVPPFTLLGAARRGAGALLVNLIAAALLGLFAWAMIGVTGNTAQWSAVSIGFYAVFSWASNLRVRDPSTFALIWGTPAFLCTAVGYGLIALSSYGLAAWTAPYAELVLGLKKTELAFWIGATSALSGFLGVIMGGRLADALRTSNPAGRIIVIMVGVLGPVVPIWIAFTTASSTVFYSMFFAAGVLGSAALGAAAATTQDLVLPRMRGTATAVFFLATTLIGLGFGPYVVGLVADLTGTVVEGKVQGNLRTGILALLGVVPPAMLLLLYAYRTVPAAEATLIERARAAGEPI
ncbi:MAG: MFS transporter [Sphingopyxis sp.]|nr:MFS transporter [Sphingopyxis sp.]